MDFKTELGQRIQNLRESKGLSRQAICDLEDVLTTRQLQRIEKGQSLPTIATAKYIADKLDVSLDVLANNNSLELPPEYIDLKYQLRTLYHYGDPERLCLLEKIIDEIYENYFENLPEEEQISIQVAQATVDMVSAKDPSFDQGLLDEYLEQAMKKKELSFNDVEIIQLRLLSLALGDFNQEEFVDLLGKVILAADYFPLSDLEKVQNTIVSAAGVLGAQTAGGAIGAAVSPSKIILGTTTANILGKEGEVLKLLLTITIPATILIGAFLFIIFGL